jgi:hypothetical protein
MTKTILLALTGMTCALAILTTPAFAEQWECNKGKAEKCSFKVNGKGQQVFTVLGAPVSCRKGTGEGVLEGAKRDLQYKPRFGECTATIVAVKHPAEVKISHCEFRLTIIKPARKPQQALVSIKPEGAETCVITVIVFESKEKLKSICTLNIGSQESLKVVRLEQIGKGLEREVQLKALVTGITSDLTGCPVLQKEGKTKDKEGVYKGLARIPGLKIREM